MAWYKTGTVAVTASNATVTGTSTAWIANAAAGMIFQGPDNSVYEILSVNSDTQITLATNYRGTTASGQSYGIAPTQDYIRALAAQVASLISTYSTIATAAGAGKFGDGTVSAPGITFVNNTNTGWYRPGTNQIALANNGAQTMIVDASGFVGIGSAVSTSKLTLAAPNQTTTSGVGLLKVVSNNSMAVNLGGQISMGGSYTGTTPTAFAAISGRKENSTDSDIAGYFALATNQSGVGMVERLRIASTGPATFSSTLVASNLQSIAEVNANTNVTAGGNISSLGNLSIGGSSTLTGNVGIGGAPVSNIRLDLKTPAATACSFRIEQTSAGDWQIYNPASSTDLRFYSGTSAADVLTLGGTGNVGVGTVPSGSYKLEVNGNFGCGSVRVYGTTIPNVGINNPTSNDLGLVAGGAERARLTSAGSLFVNATSALLSSELFGVDGGAVSAGVFKTSASAFPVTRNWNSATSGDNVFQIFYTEASATTRGSIDFNRSGVAVRYNTTSDARLKKNVRDASDSGGTIDAIQVRSFEWKETNYTTDYAFVAQELNEVFPDAVSVGDDNETEIEKAWAVDPSKLVGLLIKEVQALRGRVAALEAAAPTP
jgi:hypothetical protein